MLFGSSVESLVYLHRGSDKAQSKINNTPHLSYISERYIIIQAMSVMLSFTFKKLSDFGARIKAKHFHQNMSVGCPTTQRYKMFGTNNTLWGIVNHKGAIFFSEKRY